ncbi:MAG: hypothetical protein KAG89_10860 [Fulvimarina manganoxydans]|nr:hypothetical protein [Fulvimarina manganoxydans]MCK5932658.1 hypothetical protein [Fulvimarina manganoxydans]
MRFAAALSALCALLVLAACASPSPEVRSAKWEDNAALITGPATEY